MSDTKKMIDGLFESMFGGEEVPTTHEVSASDEVGAPILTASTTYYTQESKEEEPVPERKAEEPTEQSPCRSRDFRWAALEGEHPGTVRAMESLNKSNLWLADSLTNAHERLKEVEDKLASTESHVASLVRRQAEVDSLIKGLRELLHAAL
tara:strand:+ start:370 stop:822 length:453 start_codon:yes stop_codon:yes gene_type:complete